MNQVAANPRDRVNRWVFTLNNYTDDEVAHIIEHLEPAATYLVFGREVGENGTPHLQGFVIFPRSYRFNAVKALVGARAFLAKARGTNEEATAYCKKDGEYEEFGDMPAGQGHRSDWDDYVEWVVALGRVPSQKEIIRFSPSLWARYSNRCREIASAMLEPVNFIGEDAPRLGWQLIVTGQIAAVAGGAPAHGRKIYFYVDSVGNTGKSWVCRWALSKYPELTQILSVGRRDDICYAVDETKTIFLFDIPRTQMEFFQYSVLEMLKNQYLMSNKYQSCAKMLRRVPLVVVFSNEQPNMNAMSVDRYEIINI